MEYKFDLNLKRISMIAVATSFWQQKEIKEKIREHFRREHFSNPNECSKETWKDINKNVLQQLELINFPNTLKAELYHIVTSIGCTIYDWMEHVLKYLYYNLKLAEQIYWTPHGRVDKVRIFKLVWLNNPMLFVSKVFNIACNYCLKEYISSLWQQIPKRFQNGFFYKIKIFGECKYHLIAYWKYYLEGNLRFLITHLIEYGDSYSIYNLNNSVQENMFVLSVLEGYERGVVYFWKQLTEEEKKRILERNAKIALHRSKVSETIEKKGACLDIYIFLVTKMSEERKIAFLQENRNVIMEVFLNIWPWQELFIPVFKLVCNYLTEADFERLLTNLTVGLIEDYETDKLIRNNKYRNIFHIVWKRSSACLKQSIEQGESNILSFFLRYRDIQTLNLVLNDRDMKEQKKELIYKADYYTDLIKQDNYGLLENFMKSVLISDEEKIEFRNHFDSVDICFYFLQNFQYELAEKFLNWQFDSQEQIGNFKKNFAEQHADCWRNKIYYIWYSNDIQTAQDKISELLKWLLVTDEAIINFKKEILTRKELEKYIEKNIMNDECFLRTKEFLGWCLLSTDDIQQFRKRFNYYKTFRQEKQVLENNEDIDEDDIF